MSEKLKTDRRVRRTRALLVDALVTLLETRSFKDITVKELCDTADINRGTFYLHYKDIYDMMEQIEQDITDQLEALVSSHTSEELNANPYMLIYDIFQFTSENSALCKTLLSQNGDISFLMKIKNLCRDRFIEVCAFAFRREDHAHFEYSYNFIASGCVGLIESWLFSEQPESPEEMARLANKIITAGIQSLA